MEKQKQALLENNITLEECSKIILNRKRNLWEREMDQEDFLNLRIGMGNANFEGTVNYPEKRFSVEDDALQELVFSLGQESKILENVPINFSFLRHNITAIIGDGSNKNSFIECQNNKVIIKVKGEGLNKVFDSGLSVYPKRILIGSFSNILFKTNTS